MRKNSLVIALPVLLVAFVLPLQADSVQPDCFNVTSSLASTVRGPTVGDEQFFTLPSGPSNIMFVLDSSGSMAELPQCGDGNWGDNGSPRCTYPLSSGSTTAGRVKYPAHASSSDTVGTCAVSGDTYLSWMLGYVPVVADGPYDKGHGTSSAGLIDQPSWGFTCTNDNCMFRSDRVYRNLDRDDRDEPGQLRPGRRLTSLVGRRGGLSVLPGDARLLFPGGGA
jgi:hypothetical protein